MALRLGLGVGLTGGSQFSLASLYASGAQGLWIDLQGTPLLYTDTAGTTPATYGDSVALVLDQSKGLTRGAELVTNGNFSGGSTGWSVSAQCSIDSGAARIVSTDGSFQNVSQSKTLAGPAWYEISVDVLSIVSGGISVAFTGAGFNVALPSGIGRKTARFFVASNTSSTISVARSGGVTDVTVDNISVKELPGNHLTQATAGNRPVYARHPKTGIRNLLVQTDTLSTQSVTVTAAAHTLSFKGTGTVTLSGTSTAGPLVGTGAGNRVTLTFMPTAGTLTLTVSGSVTEAQLELGSSATAYQKVTGWYDVTEAGVPSVPYLYFNGTSTSMATSAIDFSATDKMTVFAAVRKLSDAGRGMIAELTASAAANNGAFAMTAPNAASATAAFESKGTALTDAVASTGIAAPKTMILTGQGDISGDSTKLRVNGALADTDTGDQGTGNYANAALYIGARGGSSLYFKGYIYDIAIVGAEQSAATIAAVETKLNSTVGAY